MSGQAVTEIVDWRTLTMATGAHVQSSGSACVLERHTVRRGQGWTDAPADVSPVIGEFLRSWFDSGDPVVMARLTEMDDAGRFDNTRGDTLREGRRAWLVLDWLIRVQAPAWLRLAGLTEHADALAALPPQLSHADLEASATASIASRAAVDAEAAARAVSTEASVVMDDAMGRAVSAAAWVSANTIGRSRDWNCASAALNAAKNAALAVACRAVGGDASDAASVVRVVRATLAPTVAELQARAWELLDALIACE